jgi:CRP-like cAMP-binding protein
MMPYNKLPLQVILSNMPLSVEKLNAAPHLFLKALSRQEKVFLKRNLQYKVYEKGSVIFEEGHTLEGSYYIQHGVVNTYKRTIFGGEVPISTYTAGDYFGYNPLFLDDVYTVSAVAEEDVYISFVKEEVFTKLVLNSQGLLHKVMKSLNL